MFCHVFRNFNHKLKLTLSSISRQKLNSCVSLPTFCFDITYQHQSTFTAMGKVFSIVTKPIRDFNIESRAHTVISREKPIPAPKHTIDQHNYERILKDNPDALKQFLQKNEQLDNYLKKIYLKSQDPLIQRSQEPANPEKPLPLDRSAVTDFEYGFHEPRRVPLGKITLRKAIRLISEHHVNSKSNSIAKIANDHLLPEKTVENILNFFKMYEIYIPKERKVGATFAGPVVPRKKIITEEHKLIGSSREDKN